MTKNGIDLRFQRFNVTKSQHIVHCVKSIQQQSMREENIYTKTPRQDNILFMDPNAYFSFLFKTLIKWEN